MNWSAVHLRIQGGENTSTEFKRGIDSFRPIGRTLCAFGNGTGGLLVIGVNDSGMVVGVDRDPEAVRERLTNYLHNGCGRPLTAQCDRHQTEDGWVHWVHVPWHRRGYEPFSYDRRFWVRRGRASVAPSPSELQELFNTFGLIFTEHQIIAAAHATEIDMDAFGSFMRAQGMEIEQGPLMPEPAGPLA